MTKLNCNGKPYPAPRTRARVLPVSRVRWEVLPVGGGWLGWKVTKDGGRVAWTILKADAVEWAIEVCNGRWADLRECSELIVKGRNGQIQDSSTYGCDPAKSRG